MPLRRASAVVACVLALASPGAVRAETFTVTSTNDSGPGSLRQAITSANASSDTSSTIVFSLPAGSTIVLSSQLPPVDTPTLIFDATSGPGVTIDGSAAIITDSGPSANQVTFRSLSFTNGQIDFLGTLTYDEPGSSSIDGDLSGALGLRFIKTGVGTTTITAGGTVDLVSPIATPRTARASG